MKNLLSPLKALLIAVPFVIANAYAADANSQRGQLSSSDYKFAREAAAGGQFEVAAGRLAMEKATAPAVKQFGEQMVTDHGKAGEKLKSIAAARGATLPTQPTAMHQRELDRLSRLTGTEFDKAY